MPDSGICIGKAEVKRFIPEVGDSPCPKREHFTWSEITIKAGSLAGLNTQEFILDRKKYHPGLASGKSWLFTRPVFSSEWWRKPECKDVCSTCPQRGMEGEGMSYAPSRGHHPRNRTLPGTRLLPPSYTYCVWNITRLLLCPNVRTHTYAHTHAPMQI